MQNCLHSLNLINQQNSIIIHAFTLLCFLPTKPFQTSSWATSKIQIYKNLGGTLFQILFRIISAEIREKSQEWIWLMNMTFDTFHHFLIILIACFRLYHFEVTSITLLEVKVTLTIETGKRVIMTCLESQNSPSRCLEIHFINSKSGEKSLRRDLESTLSGKILV